MLFTRKGYTNPRKMHANCYDQHNCFHAFGACLFFTEKVFTQSLKCVNHYTKQRLQISFHFNDLSSVTMKSFFLYHFLKEINFCTHKFLAYYFNSLIHLLNYIKRLVLLQLLQYWSETHIILLFHVTRQDHTIFQGRQAYTRISAYQKPISMFSFLIHFPSFKRNEVICHARLHQIYRQRDLMMRFLGACKKSAF